MINWILKIVADLSAPISRLWLRKINKDEQPDEIRRKKSEHIDREIADDDAESANRRIDDQLRAIQSRKQREGDKKG